MGCDIHGFVEAQQYPEYGWWTSLLDVGGFVGRNYEMFACLFGVRNYSNWQPIAASRGVPSDASEPVREDYQRWGGDAHSASWVTWAELKALEWNTETGGYDGYINEYRRQKTTMKRELSGDWKRLFKHMELLATTYGDDRVRMVVWFDN